MLNPTLYNSFNFLKISTWFIALVSLFLLGVLAFIVLFPQIIKATFEDRLSSVIGLDVSIERLALEFINNELLLAVHGVDVSTQTLSPIVSIDVLRWNASLFDLLKGIKIPKDININELKIYTNLIESYMSFIDIDDIFSTTGLSSLLVLDTLFINKTILQGQNTHQIAPIKLKRNKQNLILSLRQPWHYHHI